MLKEHLQKEVRLNGTCSSGADRNDPRATSCLDVSTEIFRHRCLTCLVGQDGQFVTSATPAAASWRADTCRMAATESRYGLEVQQTSEYQSKNRPIFFCPFSFQFSLETICCFCCHRFIMQHIPLGHHSMREKGLSTVNYRHTLCGCVFFSDVSLICSVV